MSMRANPTAIGLFMIGGLVITVIGVGVLASSSWFVPEATFVVFFEESVHGLERGAPVKFQGVPVGTVTELLIRIDETDKTFQVPVRFEVDLRRLTTRAGGHIHLDDPEVLRQQIANGLRAQLQMESLVTGLLFIDLKYRTDPGPPKLETRATAHPEIPTMPSLLAAFGTGAGSLIEDIVKILFRVNAMLEEVDMKGINLAVVASAQAVENMATSKDLQAALGALPEMTTEFTAMASELRLLSERLSATIEPLQGKMAGASDEALITLQALRRAVEQTEGMLSADAGLGYQLEQTLASLREAAEALRVLAISLERNPDMLIRGKQPPVR
jgi:paraquat-inducible protein B